MMAYDRMHLQLLLLFSMTFGKSHLLSGRNIIIKKNAARVNRAQIILGNKNKEPTFLGTSLEK